jgi:hypothetical protein
MTVQEFHTEFKIALDKVDSQAYPEFLDGEVDYFLNEAQDRFIKTRYGRNNIYTSGFEEMQKRTDDLKALVTSKFCSVSAVPHYGLAGDTVFRASLSALFDDELRQVSANEEYMLYLKATANSCTTSEKTCCGWSKVKLVQHDDLTSIASDPFNRPSVERPVIFFEDEDIFVWTGKSNIIDNFLVTFIRKPLKIDLGSYGGTPQTCELSEYTHKEIVQMAVRIALENVESPRQETQEYNVRNVE